MNPGWKRRTIQGRPSDEDAQNLTAYDLETPDGSIWTIRERRRVEPYATRDEQPWWVLSRTDSYGRSGFIGRKGGKTRYIDQARRFETPDDAARYVEQQTRGRKAMTNPARVAQLHLARRLSLGPGRPEPGPTEALQQMGRLRAKNDGTLNSAVISAGYYAQKFNKTMYVYEGNSYGVRLYRVSYEPGEYLDPINNTGDSVLAVTPDRTISRHQVRR